jgi:hypothetical protein
VCCTSDWDVPVEVPLYRNLDAALTAERLRPVGIPAEGQTPLVVEPGMPDGAGAMVARTAAGDCVFYHRGSGLCVVQRTLGEEMLPLTCRHFPRLAVRDARGTSISLTHYCPTAAGMLFRDDVALEIVEAPAAFPPADYEGLRVDPDAWPPLLHPRMLMDLDAYTAWERHMVACCNVPTSPESVIATLERDARVLRAYRPDEGTLVDAIAALPTDVVEAPPPASLAPSLRLHAEVMAAVPDDLRPDRDDARLEEAFAQAVVPRWSTWHAPARRYVATKAFASWTAYQGKGVLTIVRGLQAALAVVHVESARECRDAGRPLDAQLLQQAIRGADFVLNHLAVGEDLAAAWSAVETS